MPGVELAGHVDLEVAARRGKALERVGRPDRPLLVAVRHERARMKMTVPPRQTPASIRSPGTPSSITDRMHCRTFSSRLRPIIVSASYGWSLPFARRSGSNFVRTPTPMPGTGRDLVHRIEDLLLPSSRHRELALEPVSRQHLGQQVEIRLRQVHHAGPPLSKIGRYVTPRRGRRYQPVGAPRKWTLSPTRTTGSVACSDPSPGRCSLETDRDESVVANRPR